MHQSHRNTSGVGCWVEAIGTHTHSKTLTSLLHRSLHHISSTTLLLVLLANTLLLCMVRWRWKHSFRSPRAGILMTTFSKVSQTRPKVSQIRQRQQTCWTPPGSLHFTLFLQHQLTFQVRTCSTCQKRHSTCRSTSSSSGGIPQDKPTSMPLATTLALPTGLRARCTMLIPSYGLRGHCFPVCKVLLHLKIDLLFCQHLIWRSCKNFLLCGKQGSSKHATQFPAP